MDDLCLWSIVIAVCVLGAPLLVLCLPAANVSGKCSEKEGGE